AAPGCLVNLRVAAGRAGRSKPASGLESVAGEWFCRQLVPRRSPQFATPQFAATRLAGLRTARGRSAVVSGIRRVIVGASGSPGSLRALRRAEDLARHSVATLTPVLAWIPPGGELASTQPSPDL